MRQRHVVKVHRVHHGDPGGDSHMFNAERQEAEERDVDKLRGDKQCAEFGRFELRRGDKGCAVVANEHRSVQRRAKPCSFAIPCPAGSA